METVVIETREGADPAASIAALYEALCAADWAAAVSRFAPDAITEYPQSGERFLGATACVEAFAQYPGGSPELGIQRISGEGRHWTVELVVDYSTGERWRAVDLLELDAAGRVDRSVAYFAQPFAAPPWRAHLREPAEGQS